MAVRGNVLFMFIVLFTDELQLVLYPCTHGHHPSQGTKSVTGGRDWMEGLGWGVKYMLRSDADIVALVVVQCSALCNWSERSACAALWCCRQYVVSTINGVSFSTFW